MTKKLPTPYQDDKEYKKDLKRVFREDYKVRLSGKKLEKVAKEIDNLLRNFLK